MYARLILALFVSTALVGGALWTRLSKNSSIDYNLAVVEQNADEKSFFDLPVDGASVVDAKPATELTTTDIISRQFFSEYIALSSNNQVTTDRVNALVEKYVKSVGSLHTFKRAQFQDLTTTPNTRAEFDKYSISLGQTYVEYEKAINLARTSSGVGLTSESYLSFVDKVAVVYAETASKLERMPVPIAVASLHLELVNIHRSNASAMTSVAAIEQDSLPASVGFITINQNLDIEAITLEKIARIITTNAL